jgi:hypothetical protein
MIENPFWWPLELSPAADRACEELRAELTGTPAALDVAAVERASAALAALMARHVGDIVERDGLPHLCHVINGWGDARWGGAPLSDGYGAFVHRDPAGEPFVLQCDPEGDFHPWQGFAYALMAGVDPDRQLAPGGVTLRSLARHSRFLDTTEGTELGHLLFALGTLGPDTVDPPFRMRGESCDRSRLMEKAVEAHVHGGFEVCRKFHLTEGLCAMAAGFPELAGYRGVAQGFLEGQLDVLWPLAVILREAGRLIAGGGPAAPESLLAELREALVLGNYLENHCYYAGHLIELAGLAENLGYRIRSEHRSVIHRVLNELNAILPGYLPHVSFLDCFLHLGHYRRAATLWLELERERRELTPRDLAAYRCDFDELQARGGLAPAAIAASGDGAGPAAEPPGLAAGVYALASSTAAPRPAFLEVVDRYGKLAARGFEPRGKFDHFRRMGPPAWPRSVHYELLDYGADVGAEIHLESDAVRHLGGVIRGFQGQVTPLFPGRAVEWDSRWYQGRGRLRVVFPAGTPAAEVAAAMAALISATSGSLDRAARSVLVTPSDAEAALPPAPATPLLA